MYLDNALAGLVPIDLRLSLLSVLMGNLKSTLLYSLNSIRVGNILYVVEFTSARTLMHPVTSFFGLGPPTYFSVSGSKVRH